MKGAVSARVPIRPSGPAEIKEGMELTCLHCARGKDLACEVLMGMVDVAAGAGDWPEGGWVTDPGAGQTCLSYEARTDRPRVSRQQIRRLGRMNPGTMAPVCGGCAARKGSEASCALHTRRDFAASVSLPSVFLCHETGGYCGGWIRALLAKRGK